MNRRGLTLVEVLIALAIIGAAFSVLVLTQTTTMRVGNDSRKASDATEFANRVLEVRVRTILGDFAGVQASCTASPCVATVSEGRYLGSESWQTAGSSYLNQGLVQVTITMQEPAPVSFTRAVSCIDVNPPPSVALPNPCPPAVP